MSRALTLIAMVTLSACSGELWRGCTSTVVGKTVETTKEVTTGVAEGIEEGRKAGKSVDGATLVASYADLEGLGAVSVHEITGVEGAAKVVLALDNQSETPLRFSGLEVTALDKDGFVQRAGAGAPLQITVPPRAKERGEFRFAVSPDDVGTVRLWEEDLAMPSVASPAESSAE